MIRRISVFTIVVALSTALGVTVRASKNDLVVAAPLTVHEWGTFTSVAGPDGKAAQWLPLAGPGDLPCFVNYFQNRLFKSVGPIVAETQKDPLNYVQARSALLGPIRMETPVLYFYSDKSQSVDVRVRFPKGFITEWYPQADVNQAVVRKGVLENSKDTVATIHWKGVTVLPRAEPVAFPQGVAPSHYYAARATDANAIRVSGADEKFLFYRGVGGFPVPINVTTTDSGRIRVRYLNGKPSVILFENRGGRLGYTVVNTSQNEALLDSPALTGDFATLRKELESVLVRQGLYAKEAAAMVDTWRDSWFEEGTRLFYIVPTAMVDAILPLTIEPKPAAVARVFVGRVEVFTPTTLRTVEKAVRENDTSILSTYGRFLGPILERVPRSKAGNTVLDAAFEQYINQAARCSN